MDGVSRHDAIIPLLNTQKTKCTQKSDGTASLVDDVERGRKAFGENRGEGTEASLENCAVLVASRDDDSKPFRVGTRLKPTKTPVVQALVSAYRPRQIPITKPSVQCASEKPGIKKSFPDSIPAPR